MGEGVSSPHVCGSAPALPWGPCVGQSCGHKHGCCSAPLGAKEATTTLHVLSLLRDVLPCCPAAAVKTCCETLLRVMTLSHVVSVPVPRAVLGCQDSPSPGPSSTRSVLEGLRLLWLLAGPGNGRI